MAHDSGQAALHLRAFLAGVESHLVAAVAPVTPPASVAMTALWGREGAPCLLFRHPPTRETQLPPEQTKVGGMPSAFTLPFLSVVRMSLACALSLLDVFLMKTSFFHFSAEPKGDLRWVQRCTL